MSKFMLMGDGSQEASPTTFKLNAVNMGLENIAQLPMRTMGWQYMLNSIMDHTRSIISMAVGDGTPPGLQFKLPDGSIRFCHAIRFDRSTRRIIISVSDRRNGLSLDHILDTIGPYSELLNQSDPVPTILYVDDGFGEMRYCRTVCGIIGSAGPGLMFWRRTDILIQAGSVMTSALAPVVAVNDHEQVS